MSDETARPSTSEIAEAAAPHPSGEAEESGDRDGDEARLQPLLADEEAEGFRGRWQSIQTEFVDDPQQSVEQADALVAELMQQLARSFSDERASLESQWTRGDEVDTEDLRVSLRRYRSFFERLLST